MPKLRQRPVEHSRLYGFVRSRQLDGTLLTKGPGEGCYIQTARRVFAGYGCVSEARWPYPKEGEVIWPPPEPADLNEIARFWRSFYHFRLRTVDEARWFIYTSGGLGFQVNLPINQKAWHQARLGVIETPEYGDCDTRHAVYIFAYDDRSQRLSFANSWGKCWGDRGYGTLAYDYVNTLSSETWSYVPPGRYHWRPDRADHLFQRHTARTSISSDGPVGHASALIDLWEIETYTRIGWAMLSMREGGATSKIISFFQSPS